MRRPVTAGLLQRFSPRKLSWLRLWLAADRITGLADGDPVTTWADRSGQGNHATQSTTAAKPLFKTGIAGGRPVVRFDGVDDYLTVANEPTFDLSTFPIFVVGKASNDGGTFLGKVTFAGLVTDNDRRKIQVRRASSTQFVLYSGSDSANKASGTVTWTSFNVLTAVFRGATDYTLALNGAASDFATPTLDAATFNNASAIIGAATSGAEFLTGDIAEIVVYNRALSATERKAVEFYLGSRYGVAIS